MEEIKSGVLSGVNISKETAEVVENVADKMKALKNGKLNPEEVALGDIMGAGSSVAEEVAEGKNVEIGDGSQVAEQGVLTGATVSEEKAEILENVAETIEAVEEGKAAGEIENTLAKVMGVESK